MPSYISAAIAALSLSSVVSASVGYRRQEFTNSSSSSASSILSTRAPVPIGTGSSSIIISSSSTAVSVTNSTTSSTVSSASSTASAPAPYFQTTDGVLFKLEVDINYSGVEIELTILAKRAGETLGQCLSTCAANTQCVATAFDSNDDTCTFYSSVDTGSRKSAPGVTFATVQSRPSTGNKSTVTPTFPTSTRGSNGTEVTATPNTPGSNGTFPDYEGAICPLYDGNVLTRADAPEYLIACSTNVIGDVIATRKARMIRRQATFGNEWIIDCITTCDAFSTCVATTYNSAQGTCTFYSSISALFADANTDLAQRVAEEAPAATSTITTTAAGSVVTITSVPLTTSTVYSTTTRTIQSCAPGVPCSAATVTEVVVAYTTVCPVSAIPTGNSVGGAAQTVTVCTACASKDLTVTVYQCPTAPGAPGATPVAVTTKVITVPVLAAPTGVLTTSTVYGTQESVTTTCGANGCNKATVTAVVSLYTTICPATSGAPGSQAPAPPASETVVIPGTTKPASTVVAPGTTNQQTTVPAATVVVPGTTVKASSSVIKYTPTTSGVVMYTGAAVKNAGVGFAAAAFGVVALVL